MTSSSVNALKAYGTAEPIVVTKSMDLVATGIPVMDSVKMKLENQLFFVAILHISMIQRFGSWSKVRVKPFLVECPECTSALFTPR